MDKYLAIIVQILQAANEPPIVVFKDPAVLIAFQRECINEGVVIKAKRKPMPYVTQQGYLWLHNNTREYELFI